MAKKTNSGLSRAIKAVGRAFKTKDENAFDDAMENLEEQIEENNNDEDPEEAIEIHNHIPNMDGLGELPEKGAANDGEMPPWFKKHAEETNDKFKRMNDSLENLMKDRRRNNDESEPEEREEEDYLGEDDENLDMDRRAKDEPSEREEMAERMKENGANDKRNKDEANKAILGELEFEAPPGTGDRAMRAKDSRYLAEAFQEAAANAEVISPGIRLPTFDRAAPPIRTAKAIFGLRRTALDLAYNQAATRGVIDSCMSGRTMDSKRMSLGAQRVLFNAVASQVGTRNNQRATDGSQPNRTADRGAPAIQSLADINKRNRETFGRKAG